MEVSYDHSAHTTTRTAGRRLAAPSAHREGSPGTRTWGDARPKGTAMQAAAHSSDNHKQRATPLLRNLNRTSVSSKVPSTQTKCRQVLMNGGTRGQNSKSITPRGRKGTRPWGRCPEKDFQGLDLLRIVSCCADKHVLGGVRKMQGSILQKLYLAAAQTKNGK